MKTENIIGKTYFVQDSSYSVCLTNEGRSHDILGCCAANNYKLVPTKILSMPFSLKIKGRIDKSKLDFILIGDDNENVYSVIFKKEGVVSEEKTFLDFQIDAERKKDIDYRYIQFDPYSKFKW